MNYIKMCNETLYQKIPESAFKAFIFIVNVTLKRGVNDTLDLILGRFFNESYK